MSTKKFRSKEQAEKFVQIYREGQLGLEPGNLKQVKLYLKQGDKYGFSG